MIAYKSQTPPANPLLDETSHELICERPLLPPFSQIQPTHTIEQIDEIIGDQIVSTLESGYHRFLVRWKEVFCSLERTI